MEESLIKRLIATIKCSSCGQNYEEDCVDIIKHIEELWFLKVSCSHCGVKSLVTVVIRTDKEPEVITDLNEAELERFRDMDVVGEDDMLDMHNFLKVFDGDFPRLFRQ
jgi:C4-type Zn-finger protein